MPAQTPVPETPPVADPPEFPPGGLFVHPALFYAGEQEYLAGTVPFVEEGLRAGAPVAVSVPGPQLAALRAAVGPAGERVTWLDMTREGRNPGRIIPGVLRAFADRHAGAGRVHIIGEPIWPGRTATEYPACAQHEALINLAFAGREVTILCPYDTVGLDPQVIADARATHPEIIDRDGTHASDGYAPARVVADQNLPLPEPAGPAALMDFDRDALPELRAFACRHAAGLGLPPRRVGELELAVNELAANSVVHGGGTGRLRLWAENGQVVCEVADRGLIADPLAGRRPAAMSTNGGRGLLMVHHIADLVRMHTGPAGTVVRIFVS
ncbi:sensor histidine kinase [Actinomadura macrotermitis]|nr:sensor histidine kinase [Actinomadura macrotermitis]